MERPRKMADGWVATSSMLATATADNGTRIHNGPRLGGGGGGAEKKTGEEYFCCGFLIFG